MSDEQMTGCCGGGSCGDSKPCTDCQAVIDKCGCMEENGGGSCCSA